MIRLVEPRKNSAAFVVINENNIEISRTWMNDGDTLEGFTSSTYTVKRPASVAYVTYNEQSIELSRRPIQG